MCNKTSFDGENSLSTTSDEASSLDIPETLEHPSTKPEKTPIHSNPTPLSQQKRRENKLESRERL